MVVPLAPKPQSTDAGADFLRGESPEAVDFPRLWWLQQVELIALLVSDLDLSPTELSTRLGMPHPSVHREVGRAETAGVLMWRKIGNTRLVRAYTASP